MNNVKPFQKLFLLFYRVYCNRYTQSFKYPILKSSDLFAEFCIVLFCFVSFAVFVFSVFGCSIAAIVAFVDTEQAICIQLKTDEMTNKLNVVGCQITAKVSSYALYIRVV